MPKFLSISPDTTLSDLSNQIGYNNLNQILNANGLSRTRNIGEAYRKLCETTIVTSPIVSNQRKCTLLNTVTGDSDVFEVVALLSDSEWKQFNKFGSLLNYLRIPDSISIPDSANILGNNIPVVSTIYKEAIQMLFKNGFVDPEIFNVYTSPNRRGILTNNSISTGAQSRLPAFQGFKIPWGEISLYSSLSDELIDFPVYPIDPSDKRVANYTTMPDLLYQFEPWQLYQSSGPRENPYKFIFHRDMWTGNHLDGKANELIRFCQANCYPEYRGSTVNTSTVTLYIKSNPLITGIMNEVSIDYSGPYGYDGWQLVCELTLQITEVSSTPLSYSKIKSKPLIG